MRTSFSAGSATYWQYFGTAAGDSGKFYYSYDLGTWHVVVLNSAIATSAGSYAYDELVTRSI